MANLGYMFSAPRRSLPAFVGDLFASTTGQSLRFFGRPLLNNGGLSANISPAQSSNPAPLANSGPSQNHHGALLYNNDSPLPCAVALLSRAGALCSGITPVLSNARALADNNCALPDNIGAKLSSPPAKERNDTLPHEGRGLSRLISPMQFTPN